MRDTVTQTEIRHASQTKSERERGRRREGEGEGRAREKDRSRVGRDRLGPEPGGGLMPFVLTVNRALYPRGP